MIINIIILNCVMVVTLVELVSSLSWLWWRPSSSSSSSSSSISYYHHYHIISIFYHYCYHHTSSSSRVLWDHDDVMKWNHFPRNWPFVREIHRSPVNFPHKGQWRGALMFSLNYAWINDWVNNREAGDLRRQHGHYDVIVMLYLNINVRYDGVMTWKWCPHADHW